MGQSITRDFPLCRPGCVSFYFAWNEEDYLPYNDFMRVSYVDENGVSTTLITLDVEGGDKTSWQKVVLDIPDEAVGSVLKFEGLVQNDNATSFLYLDAIEVSQGSCPSSVPSSQPSSAPSAGPSSIPSLTPSGVPSSSPSFDPSGAPSGAPSSIPSEVPSGLPTVMRGECENLDSFRFKGNPSLTCDSYVARRPNVRCKEDQPGTGKQVKYFCPAVCKNKCKKTGSPTATPTATPTSSPSASPTLSGVPSSSPSLTPSGVPSSSPSLTPSGVLSSSPSFDPSGLPSFGPSLTPSLRPSSSPTLTTSGVPSSSPSFDPSGAPSGAPSSIPSEVPSGLPTVMRGECENLDSFRFKGNPSLTCDSYVARRPNVRCKEDQPGTGKQVKYFCPAVCKRKCKKTGSPTATPTAS